MNSKNMSSKLMLCVVTVAFVSVAMSDDLQDVQECTSSLVGLATCLPYVGGTAKYPTPDCCTGLKQVLKTSKKCLCVVVKDRNDPNLSLQINITLVLGLPDTCKTPADLSDCPGLLKLPPNSPEAQIFYQLKPNSTAISPAPAPTPANAQGSSPTRGSATGSRVPPSSNGSKSQRGTIVRLVMFRIAITCFLTNLIHIYI